MNRDQHTSFSPCTPRNAGFMVGAGGQLVTLWSTPIFVEDTPAASFCSPAGIRRYWPSPQDYSEAVQTPAISFADSELRSAKVATNHLGLPICISGNFASVFCFDTGERRIAVRCFLNNVCDQQLRYKAISTHVPKHQLPFTVPCEFVEHGIRMRGEWYPILKMDWIDGVTLHQFVSSQVNNSMALDLLAGYFRQMVLQMQKVGIAHGDLQHDNILICRGELKLVDYDCMYVSELAGRSANELGHCNYQHPGRTTQTFGPALDNFSAWIIYTALQALSIEPRLWDEFDAQNGECLLFRKSDLLSFSHSQLIKRLLTHREPQLRLYAQAICRFLNMPVTSVPSLDAPLELLQTPFAALSRPSLQSADVQFLGSSYVSENNTFNPAIKNNQPAAWWQQTAMVEECSAPRSTTVVTVPMPTSDYPSTMVSNDQIELTPLAPSAQATCKRSHPTQSSAHAPPHHSNNGLAQWYQHKPKAALVSAPPLICKSPLPLKIDPPPLAASAPLLARFCLGSATGLSRPLRALAQPPVPLPYTLYSSFNLSDSPYLCDAIKFPRMPSSLPVSLILDALRKQISPAEKIRWQIEQSTWDEYSIELLLAYTNLTLLALLSFLASKSSPDWLVFIACTLWIPIMMRRRQECVRAFVLTDRRLMKILETRSECYHKLEVHAIPMEKIEYVRASNFRKSGNTAEIVSRPWSSKGRAVQSFRIEAMKRHEIESLMIELHSNSIPISR